MPAIAGGRPVRIVPLARPRPYSRAERRELARVLAAQETSYSDGGGVRRFEQAAAETFGSRHAIATSSGSAALHAALIAAGVGPGDEVVVPVLTHAADALAVLHSGARARFADADAATWNVDPGAVEASLSPRTRAIVAVHLCGVPCDLDRLGALARERGLRLIEDAAQAHGALYRGRSVGTHGDLDAFSFQSAKILTMGEDAAPRQPGRRLSRRALRRRGLVRRADARGAGRGARARRRAAAARRTRGGQRAPRRMLRAVPDAGYLDLDLPEVLALASYYLALEHPARELVLFGEGDPFAGPLGRGAIAFLPAWECARLPDGGVAAYVNRSGLGEMRRQAVALHLSRAARASRWLVHVNHEARRRVPGETLLASEYPVPAPLRLLVRQPDIASRFFAGRANRRQDLGLYVYGRATVRPLL